MLARYMNMARNKFIKTNRKEVVRWFNRHLFKPLGLSVSLAKRAESSKQTKLYDFDEECRRHFELIKNNTTPVIYTRMVTLYQQVRYLESNGVKGDFVETGVWKGGAAGMMALANMDSGAPPRAMHLFDSFEGLPKAQHADGIEAQKFAGRRKDGDSLESGGALSVDESWVKDLFNTINYPESSTHIHKGWFQDTVPLYAANRPQIALLRLDGDLYESTKVCLDNLWELVVPNGVVIIDDYLAFEGCKKAVDEFFDTLTFRPLLHSIHGMGGRYLIKPAEAKAKG